MSVRVAFVGDLHLGKQIRGYDRTPDVVSAWERCVSEAVAEGCSYLIQTGDVYDDSHPSPELATTGVRLFASAAPRFHELHVLVGNHDLRHSIERSDALAPLREVLPPRLHVHATPSARALRGGDGVVSQDEAVLLCLPYESKSRRKWSSPAEYDALIVRLLDRADPSGDLPVVVVGHLDIDGAQLASEVLARGGGHPWPTGAGWRDRVSHAIDGHFHRPQACSTGGWTIHVVGSPVALDFGEAGEVKRWIYVDVG